MKPTLLAVAVTLASAFAFAQPASVRAAHLQGRITHGVATGELTGREAARLQVQENRLQARIARDRVDGGGMTAREQAKLQRQEDRLSRRIAVQKHDRQAR